MIPCWDSTTMEKHCYQENMFNCFQNSGASQQPVSKPLQRHQASFSDSIVFNLTWVISQQLGKCVTGFVSETSLSSAKMRIWVFTKQGYLAWLAGFRTDQLSASSNSVAEDTATVFWITWGHWAGLWFVGFILFFFPGKIVLSQVVEPGFCSTLLVLNLLMQQMQEYGFRQSWRDKWANLLNAADCRAPCAKHLLSGR